MDSKATEHAEGTLLSACPFICSVNIACVPDVLGFGDAPDPALPSRAPSLVGRQPRTQMARKWLLVVPRGFGSLCPDDMRQQKEGWNQTGSWEFPSGALGWTRKRESLEGRGPGRNSLEAVSGRVDRKCGGRITKQEHQGVGKLNGETGQGEAESECAIGLP